MKKYISPAFQLVELRSEEGLACHGSLGPKKPKKPKKPKIKVRWRR